jgi:hypothetical protein
LRQKPRVNEINSLPGEYKAKYNKMHRISSLFAVLRKYYSEHIL